jgi:LacI family transcriptional regulator
VVKQMRRAPTILDVASEAGVSKSTVSNVIRGSSAVAEATRHRVLLAVEQLGYRPNVIARNLVQRQTSVFGVVVGDLGNPFYAEMAKHVEREAARRGFRAMFCNTQGDDDTVLSSVESMLEHRVAGLVFLATSGDHVQLRDSVGDRVPTVFVSCPSDWGDVVCADDRGGAEIATQHLIDLGHQRIVYLADPIVEDAADRNRQSGYRQAMQREHLTPVVVHWARTSGDLLPASIDGKVAQILSDGTTAVFSSNDLGAIELLECADRLGVHVPEDLSVVGFDDVVMAGLARINLTTVRQPKPELARLAVEMLAGRAGGDVTGRPIRRTVDVELVVRRSTSAVPTAV